MLEDVYVASHEMMDNADYGIRKLVLRGSLARIAEPGQFVHVKVSSGHDPLLRRPISIFSIDRDQEEITLLYRIKGKGTELLSRVSPGETLNVMGPLGKGFSLPEQGELWLVAGGIGSFPLYALAAAAKSRGIRTRLFWGGEDKGFLESAGLFRWKALEIPVHLATLDGSLGKKGLVTEILKEELSKEDLNQTETRAAVCGPHGMMKAASVILSEFQIKTEVSLEERMGCAVGACLGCVATLKNLDGKLRRGKVCQEGPVFNGEEVVWDADY